MTIYRYHLPDLSCGHCVVTVTKTLRAIPSVHAISVDLADKMVEFTLDDASVVDTVRAHLSEAGYVSEPPAPPAREAGL